MDREATVSSYLERIGSGNHLIWSPIFRRNLNENEESQMILLLLLLNLLTSVYITRGQDERIWIPSRDSSFSVTSFFMALSERVETSSALGRLWKLKAPPRILVFGWLAL
eukprot:TRINITY_DN15081_c1_g5_i1.p2 TRINITY_DN15081_c1_g5~~TRINITY_DN15081_c1_g5_i1.p2  ORF type:complete len:110 (-),score=15.40 TRINITY_DN15081_c1_g5_i1:140-469(-)